MFSKAGEMYISIALFLKGFVSYKFKFHLYKIFLRVHNEISEEMRKESNIQDVFYAKPNGSEPHQYGK